MFYFLQAANAGSEGVTGGDSNVIQAVINFLGTLPLFIQIIIVGLAVCFIIGQTFFILAKIYIPIKRDIKKTEKFESTINDLKNKIDILEDFMLHFVYSKSIKVDISNVSYEDKAFFTGKLNEMISKNQEYLKLYLAGLQELMNYEFDGDKTHLDQARTHLRDSLGKSPSIKEYQSEIFNYWGVAFDKDEKYYEAIVKFDKGIKEYENNYKCYYNRACTLESIFKNIDSLDQKMIKALEKYLELDDMELTQYCKKKGIEDLEKTVELNPKEAKTILADPDLEMLREAPELRKKIDKLHKADNLCGEFKLKVNG